MEKEMKELYSEGLAIHGDPEPWVGIREDAGEAFVSVQVIPQFIGLAFKLSSTPTFK
jgi:hypothetical protein